jgi:hypothetical protein
MPDTLEELKTTCEGIKRDLDRIVDGNIKKCSVCGEKYVLYNVDDGEGDSDEVWKQNCECEGSEAVDYMMRDYFEDSDGDSSYIDVNYTVARDGTYRSATFTMGWGGPNIYIDTGKGEVQGYWGYDSYTVPLSSYVRDAIDEVGEYFWDGVREYC